MIWVPAKPATKPPSLVLGIFDQVIVHFLEPVQEVMSSLRPNGPRPSELERNHILNDIVENIENRFARKYNLVDYGTLKKEVLIPVIEKEFNSEIQLRGFLRAFRNTSAFKNSFESIGDPTLKKQITAFIEGKPSDDAVRNHDFEVSGHPSLLSVFKNLFVCALQLKEAIKNIFPSRHRYVQDLPEFWEDEEQTMKVICSTLLLFSLNADNHNAGGG